MQRPNLPALVVFAALTAACVSTALLAKPVPAKPVPAKPVRLVVDSSHSANTKWIEKSLKQMEKIKVGMTRQQLLTVFTTEGGLSTRRWHRYVYRDCPYIKVDVDFSAYGDPKSNAFPENPKDVITKISHPFLEWEILD